MSTAMKDMTSEINKRASTPDVGVASEEEMPGIKRVIEQTSESVPERGKENPCKRIKYRILILAFIFVFACPNHSRAVKSIDSQINAILRNRIEASGIPSKIAVGNEIIHSSSVLPVFYERLLYRPAWFTSGSLISQARVLLKLVREAVDEGLNPEDYHLSAIQSMISRKTPLPAHSIVDLDLLLTDAFLLYGAHLLSGKVNPETIDPEWHANRREADMAEILETALSLGEIEKTVRGLLPRHPGYDALKQSLAKYRETAAKGEWPKVPDGPKMQKGNRGERIRTLRERLSRTIDDMMIPADDYLFDESLERAVREFQRTHGLEEDGIVGPATLAALNVSVRDRMQQIALNMERWRWLPNDLGERYILVNIANYRLDVIEDMRIVMEMRVIIGKYYRRTPVFSDRMTYLVLSPYWYIPTTIAVQDKLPLAKRKPDYFRSQGIRVFRGQGAEAEEVDPGKVDWSSFSSSNFPFRLRQDPGPFNSLGRVKFMFPNKYKVYLHDTPSRELFSKSVRSFSSGCIRVEKALELAEYLLRDRDGWTRERMLGIIHSKKEHTVQLKQPIPVHLLYWTAWVDHNGILHFRKDIYGRDRMLGMALESTPP